MGKVTDPALLAELDSAPTTRVSDPALLAELEGGQAPAKQVTSGGEASWRGLLRGASARLGTKLASGFAPATDALFEALHPDADKIPAARSIAALKGYETNRNALAGAEHPYLSTVTELAGMVPGLVGAGSVLAPFKAAQGAGAAARAAAMAKNGLVAGRILRGLTAAGDSQADTAGGTLGDAAKAAFDPTGMALDAGLGAAPAVLGGAISRFSPALRRMAGSLKVASLRPVPTLAEDMAALPGGKAAVGEALLRRGVGGLTSGGTAKQIAAELEKTGQSIGDIAHAADLKAAPTPPEIYTSGTGNPDEIDAVAAELKRQLRWREAGPGSGAPPPRAELLPGPPSGSETSPARRLVGVPTDPAAAPVPSLPAAGFQAPPLNERLLRTAQEEVAGPLAAHWEPKVQKIGADLRASLANLAEQQGRGNSADRGVDLYRDMYRTAYNLEREPAALTYRKGLQDAAGVVREGVGSYIDSVSPELAQGFEGANLDYRRLLAAREAADRLAGRQTSNRTLGLLPHLAGMAGIGAAGVSGHGGLGAVGIGAASALATKLLDSYGPQVGARALYGLGSLGAATGKAGPNLSPEVAALIKAIQERAALSRVALPAAAEGDR